MSDISGYIRERVKGVRRREGGKVNHLNESAKIDAKSNARHVLYIILASASTAAPDSIFFDSYSPIASTS